MNRRQRYEAALEDIPPTGYGCHPALLGVANLGVRAELTDQQIFDDLRATVYGDRYVPDREIIDAIKKARGDSASGWQPQSKAKPLISPDYLHMLIERGEGATEEDLIRLSPVAIPSDPLVQTETLLKSLYRKQEHLYAGGPYGTAVLPAEKLLDEIILQDCIGYPHICPNPMSGKKAPKKSGGLSYRCDAAVADYRFAVVEFDEIPKEEQLAFWRAVPLPVVALIDSGGKSIHGWIKVNGIATAEQWYKAVKIGLYEQRLVPLGVDPQCANSSRLSRLPGHQRDGGRMQRLLYLNPDPAPGGIR